MPAAALVLAPLASPVVSAASATLALGVGLRIAAASLEFRRLGQEARQRLGLAGGLSSLQGGASFRPAPLGGRLPPRPPSGGSPDPGWMLPIGVALLGSFPSVRQGLSQAWAYLNSRPDQTGGGSVSGDELLYLGSSGVDEPIVVGFTWFVRLFRSYGDSGTGGNTGGPQSLSVGAGTSVRIIGRGSGRLEVTPADQGPKTIGGVVAEVRKADGTKTAVELVGPLVLSYSVGVFEWLERDFSVSSVTAGGRPALLAGGVPSGFRVPQIVPDEETDAPRRPPMAPPAPSPAPPAPPATDPNVIPGQPAPGTPAPQPPGTPAPAPAIPRPARPGEWQPGGPGTPSQPVPPGFPAPTIAPSRSPVPVPVRPPAVPGSQPTTPAGQVVPRPTPRPPVTRPGTEVIGGITIPNRPPAPTLQGIAAEVGRIEQKLAYQLRNPEEGNQDLESKLQELLDALENQQDSGAYELGGPCERDAEGLPIPFDETVAQFEWGGKTSALANIASRIDALAELMQYHKLLKQPKCTPPPQSGEWVTVNFRQTDFQAP